MVSQKTFFETFIKEVVMQFKYLIKSFNVLKLLCKLIEVRFKHLYNQVVYIVLTKMMHSMSQIVGLHVERVNFKLLC